MDAAPQADFETAASNAFAAALCSRLATGLGVRALVVKGESLRRWALRFDRQSADADLLFADHDDVERVAAALADVGWYRRETGLASGFSPGHSITMNHPRWPAALDLHYRFPGLPQAAFDHLWENRVGTAVAGHTLWIPNRSGAIVIWALHSLRGSIDEPRHAAELDALVTKVLPALTRQQRADLRDTIHAVGSGFALREVPGFADLLGDTPSRSDPDTAEAWRRIQTQKRAATGWLEILRRAPARKRPYLVFRALWPSRHDLALGDPAVVDTPLGRVGARWRRGVRLVRRLSRRSGRPRLRA